MIEYYVSTNDGLNPYKLVYPNIYWSSHIRDPLLYNSRRSAIPITWQYKISNLSTIKNDYNYREHGLLYFSNKYNNYAVSTTMPKRRKLAMENFVNNSIYSSMINRAKHYAIDYTLKYIKNRFGVTLKLDFDKNTTKKFLCWLKKYDKNFKTHIEPVSLFGSEKMYKLKDCDFVIKCGYNTFARIYTQTAIKNSLNKADLFADRHVGDSEIYMYVFGKECYKVVKEIKRLDEQRNIACFKVSAPRYNKDENATPEIFYEDLHRRYKESIFLNDDIKEMILNHIDNFLANRSLYQKRNLMYKTGILLEGPPGTGKTSLTNMIATEYNSDMVLINMSEFSHINTDFLSTTINADDKFYVVVLEDIDCVIGNRDSEEDDLENKKNVNKLLQFLDSTSSPTNVIFVATTNHIDRLDDAIKRDGRFDLIVNIDNINIETAIRMCKSFGITDDDTINAIIKDNIVDNKINPAKLQNLILQNIELNNKTVLEEK